MPQELELPGIGDRVEVIGRLLHHDLMEYDGCEARVVGIFKDSRGVRCATVEVESEHKGRAGKRYFVLSALKKIEPRQ